MAEHGSLHGVHLAQVALQTHDLAFLPVACPVSVSTELLTEVEAYLALLRAVHLVPDGLLYQVCGPGLIRRLGFGDTGGGQLDRCFIILYRQKAGKCSVKCRRRVTASEGGSPIHACHRTPTFAKGLRLTFVPPTTSPLTTSPPGRTRPPRCCPALPRVLVAAPRRPDGPRGLGATIGRCLGTRSICSCRLTRSTVPQHAQPA